MKQVTFWVVIFIAIFCIAYTLTDILVKSVMADYKAPVRVSARVDGLKVEAHPYTTNEPLQPAYNITKL